MSICAQGPLYIPSPLSRWGTGSSPHLHATLSCREPMASQALAASKASSVRKVTKVQEVFLGPLGRWGCR